MKRKATSIHVISITSQGQITIPKALRKELNLQHGQKVWAKVVEGKLSITPATRFEEQRGSLKQPGSSLSDGQ
jgi:AbrB family looped-hinge helix DNA binding protein